MVEILDDEDFDKEAFDNLVSQSKKNEATIGRLTARVAFLESWLIGIGQALFVILLWIVGPYIIAKSTLPKWLVLIWLPLAYLIYAFLEAKIKNSRKSKGLP